MTSTLALVLGVLVVAVTVGLVAAARAWPALAPVARAALALVVLPAARHLVALHVAEAEQRDVRPRKDPADRTAGDWTPTAAAIVKTSVVAAIQQHAPWLAPALRAVGLDVDTVLSGLIEQAVLALRAAWPADVTALAPPLPTPRSIAPGGSR